MFLFSLWISAVSSVCLNTWLRWIANVFMLFYEWSFNKITSIGCETLSLTLQECHNRTYPYQINDKTFSLLTFKEQKKEKMEKNGKNYFDSYITSIKSHFMMLMRYEIHFFFSSSPRSRYMESFHQSETPTAA